MPDSCHLDAEAVYSLLDGRLPAALERTAEAHLWRCPTCRALREECAATLSALRWYAAAPPAPPAGYWESFWMTLPMPGIRPDVLAGAPVVQRYAPLALAASLAAVLALGAGVWWSRSGQSGSHPGAGSPYVTTIAARQRTVAASAPSGDEAWEDDWAFFERVTYAIGSVDPLSKGVALAGLAEASRGVAAEPPNDVPVDP